MLDLELDLVGPEDLDPTETHVLSFLFGTNKQTELIKCGWNPANFNENIVQQSGYLSKQL